MFTSRYRHTSYKVFWRMHQRDCGCVRTIPKVTFRPEPKSWISVAVREPAKTPLRRVLPRNSFGLQGAEYEFAFPYHFGGTRRYCSSRS
jgi:hypothetical protein